MREIDPIEAREKHGIYTLHHQMKNNEFRFRLKKTDGTAYIRTDASDVGGWQESHYHDQVRETYIVQQGWIAYAEMTNSGPQISIFRENELFTTQPKIIHNVFMSSNSIIHTIKHGACTSEDRETRGTSDLEAYCNRLKDEAEILAQGSRANAATKSRASYTEQYRHFDNLIWQVPAWATAIFALSLQGFAEGDIKNIAKIAGVSDNYLAAFLLFALSFMILCFAHVMYRFRLHQRGLKEYQNTPLFKSASSYTQFMVFGQAASLFVLALLALNVPLSEALAVGVIGLITLTVSRELRLRSDVDSIAAR